MGYERLEIFRFSQNGEVLRRLVCLAGMVSVFRARNPRNIELYRDALIGRPTTSRFSILLDGSTFRPNEHHFIGYPDTQQPEIQQAVGSILEAHGVSADDLEPTLVHFGLGGLSNASYAELSEPQQTMIQILAATASSDRLLICNNPFQNLPEAWHDKLATRLTNYAWKQRAIVVITELHIRPESWVENEFIARLALEPPRKATIGYGGSGTVATELVSAIREQVKEVDRNSQDASATAEIDGGKNRVSLEDSLQFFKTALTKRGKSQYRLAGLILATFALALVTNLLHTQQRERAPEQLVVASRTAPAQLTPVVNTPNESSKPSSILDAYPEYVRNAVSQAFNNPEDVIRARAEEAARNSKRIKRATPRTPVPARQVSPATSAPRVRRPERSRPPASAEESDREEQRRKRREAFLEAIRRSRNDDISDEERDERAARRERLLEALRRHRMFREDQEG